MKEKKIGRFLKALREDAGLSQGDVTKDLGYKANQYVSDWERGKSTVPLEKIIPLARLLKIRPKELLSVCYPVIKEIIEK